LTHSNPVKLLFHCPSSEREAVKAEMKVGLILVKSE
jgi:hypothetical protein